MGRGVRKGSLEHVATATQSCIGCGRHQDDEAKVATEGVGRESAKSNAAIVRTVSVAEAKARLGGLIDDIARRGERVTITKHGRPAAVLMSHDEATRLDATLEIMS